MCWARCRILLDAFSRAAKPVLSVVDQAVKPLKAEHAGALEEPDQ
jgi:hypothetical protein